MKERTELRIVNKDIRSIPLSDVTEFRQRLENQEEPPFCQLAISQVYMLRPSIHTP